MRKLALISFDFGWLDRQLEARGRGIGSSDSLIFRRLITAAPQVSVERFLLSGRPESRPDLLRSIIINSRDRSLCLNMTPSIKSAVINGPTVELLNGRRGQTLQATIFVSDC